MNQTITFVNINWYLQKTGSAICLGTVDPNDGEKNAEQTHQVDTKQVP